MIRMLMRNQPPERLAALTHYVIARTPADQLGATKLNKVLWWVDCAAFRRWGQSMSGLGSYRRLQNGPVPEGSAVDQLKRDGAIVERGRQTYAGVRREFISILEPPVHLFTAEEIDVINQVIVSVCRMTASEASEASHDALWEETPHLGAMPVAAGAISVREVASDDVEWAKHEMARLSL
jgi:Protein of unknown function (DUF4065)